MRCCDFDEPIGGEGLGEPAKGPDRRMTHLRLGCVAGLDQRAEHRGGIAPSHDRADRAQPALDGSLADELDQNR